MTTFTNDMEPNEITLIYVPVMLGPILFNYQRIKLDEIIDSGNHEFDEEEADVLEGIRNLCDSIADIASDEYGLCKVEHDYKVGQRVYWSDPGENLASGCGTIFRIGVKEGEPIEDDTIISLTLDSGSEAEVLVNEIRHIAIPAIIPTEVVSRMVVAATNANGEPDFFFTGVTCSRTQYQNGEHYDFAKEIAKESGYESPMVAYDEFNSAGKAMMPLFTWGSCSYHNLSER